MTRAYLFAAALGMMAFMPEIAEAKSKPETIGNIEIGIRQSTQDLDWNIASDLTGTTTPNILSELEFSDIEVWHIWTKFDWPIFNRLTIHGYFDYGYVDDGTVTDSDYFGDDRTDVFSISRSLIDGQNTADAELGLGWQFRWKFEWPMWRMGDSGKRMALSSDVLFTPEIGYSYYAQDLRITDGVQVVPDFGAFAGLRSEYDAEWRGLFAGAKTRIRIAGRLSLIATYRYIPGGSYVAEAVWNLRSDFDQDPSFIHRADFDGQRLSAGLEWTIGKEKDRVVSLEYHDSKFETEAGIDETRFADGTTVFIRLNEANYRSQGLSLGFRWMFE